MVRMCETWYTRSVNRKNRGLQHCVYMLSSSESSSSSRDSCQDKCDNQPIIKRAFVANITKGSDLLLRISQPPLWCLWGRARAFLLWLKRGEKRYRNKIQKLFSSIDTTKKKWKPLLKIEVCWITLCRHLKDTRINNFQLKKITKKEK